MARGARARAWSRRCVLLRGAQAGAPPEAARSAAACLFSQLGDLLHLAHRRRDRGQGAEPRRDEQLRRLDRARSAIREASSTSAWRRIFWAARRPRRGTTPRWTPAGGAIGSPVPSAGLLVPARVLFLAGAGYAAFSIKDEPRVGLRLVGLAAPGRRRSEDDLQGRLHSARTPTSSCTASRPSSRSSRRWSCSAVVPFGDTLCFGVDPEGTCVLERARQRWCRRPRRVVHGGRRSRCRWST